MVVLEMKKRTRVQLGERQRTQHLIAHHHAVKSRPLVEHRYSAATKSFEGDAEVVKQNAEVFPGFGG